MAELTPRQIVQELDRYIIGQDEAKRAVAIALRNRWRRRQVDDSIRDEIMPNNIIMIGPTGVGKTEIARRLARLAQAPFVKVEATKFTEVGYVGRDVESMIRDLVEVSITMEKEKSYEEVSERAWEHAIDRILDMLIPASKEDDLEEGMEERRGRTKEKLRIKLERGDLDARELTIETEKHAKPVIEIFSGAGLEEMGVNFPDELKHLMPGRKRGRRVTVEQAKKILHKEEKEKLVDIDRIKEREMREVEKTGIVLIEEIEKIVGR